MPSLFQVRISECNAFDVTLHPQVYCNATPQSGFPLFRTDKIPWLFQYLLPFFQYFFNVLLFFKLKIWPISANNAQFILISLEISNNIYLSLPVFCGIFPDFSSLFKIPWLFPDWKMPSHFSRFSSLSGNPGVCLSVCLSVCVCVALYGGILEQLNQQKIKITTLEVPRTFCWS